jgi:hypothetical protein
VVAPQPLRGKGVKIKHPSTGGDPLKELAGIGRVVGHGVGALAESTYKDPLGSAAKTATLAGEIAKGVAGAAIGLPVYAVEHPLKTLSGEGAAHIAKRVGKGVVKYYSKKYGPSYRGEKGSYRKLEKQVEKEGPLPTALDVATLVAPGIGARQGG